MYFVRVKILRRYFPVYNEIHCVPAIPREHVADFSFLAERNNQIPAP